MSGARERTWRLLTDDGAGAADGLAGDEVLAQRAGTGSSPPTLRLYTYRPHCALVGRFQDAAAELHLAYCARHCVEVGRRPTGGGAILMGPDQLGVALALSGRGASLAGRPRALMQRFSHGLTEALGALGIEAAFRGKNDLAVGGRKIAGLGVWRAPDGGLLFHASLLVDLDVARMARVLVTPFAKVGDAERALLARGMTTVRAQLGSAVAVDDVRAQVAAGFARAFGRVLEPGGLSGDELTAIAQLAREKYASEGWVHQRTDVPDTRGAVRRATPAGLLDVRVRLAGGTIKAAYVHGDFFADEAALAELEGRLRWHPADGARLDATVAAWARAHGDALAPAELTAALCEAVRCARAAAPHGCFVRDAAAEVAHG